MQVFTIKAKPGMLFGAVLAITGIIVVLLTFISNHSGKAVGAQMPVSCQNKAERSAYISALGWEFDENETEKEITIPLEFNQVYKDYNEIQKQQGFDLEDFKRKTATVYTYNITNYKDNGRVIADLIVCGGVLIGADLCDPSASDGFLIALGENTTNGTD